MTRSSRCQIEKFVDDLLVQRIGDVERGLVRVVLDGCVHAHGSRLIWTLGSVCISRFQYWMYSRMNISSVAGAFIDAVAAIDGAAGNIHAAMHVDPLVLEGAEPALDLLEIGEIVDLAEIREAFLRAHAQRIDEMQFVAPYAFVVDHGGAVPDRVGFVDAERLEHLEVVPEDRQVREDVDVDRLGRSEIERRRRAVAEPAAQFRLVMLHAGMRAFHRPHRARLDLHVRALVLEVMAVAEILHVHRLLVRPALVIGHALGAFLDQPVLHVEQRAMREHDVIAVA